MTHSSIDPQSTVAELVTADISRSRVFERFGIDYCCGGKQPLDEACAKRGVEVAAVAAALDAAAARSAEGADLRRLPLEALANHILETHHRFLHDELEPLGQLVAKVNRAHGEAHPELAQVEQRYSALVDELQPHMEKEERGLFPACAAAPAGLSAAAIGPLCDALEEEHSSVGRLLGEIRAATADFAVPEGACRSYQAMLFRLAALEEDVHLHVHKENNILLPRLRASLGAAA